MTPQCVGTQMSGDYGDDIIYNVCSLEESNQLSLVSAALHGLPTTNTADHYVVLNLVWVCVCGCVFMCACELEMTWTLWQGVWDISAIVMFVFIFVLFVINK